MSGRRHRYWGAQKDDEELPCAQVLFWALERAPSRARDNPGNKQFPVRILDSYARENAPDLDSGLALLSSFPVCICT